MKIAETYKAFKKFKRKYYKKYMHRKTDVIRGKKITSYWTNLQHPNWIGFRITQSTLEKEPNVLKYSDPSTEIFVYRKVIQKCVGRKVVLESKCGDKLYHGILNSVFITNFDIYWEIKAEEDSDTAELIPIYLFSKIRIV